MAAEALLKMKLNLDAQYLGAYTVECALKALILHKADDRSRARWLRQITRGSEMHAPEKVAWDTQNPLWSCSASLIGR